MTDCVRWQLHCSRSSTALKRNRKARYEPAAHSQRAHFLYAALLLPRPYLRPSFPLRHRDFPAG